jgi:hypothetical protein
LFVFFWRKFKSRIIELVDHRADRVWCHRFVVGQKFCNLRPRNWSDDVANHQSQCFAEFDVPRIARERFWGWNKKLRPFVDSRPRLRTNEAKRIRKTLYRVSNDIINMTASCGDITKLN